MAMKIDIRKAFDSLNWEFLLDILDRFGFSSNFCSWIKAIFQSAKISILINGVPEGYFSCSSGVRQGDPLSSLLFVLAEDYLSRLVMKAVSDGHLSPMGSSRGSVAPSHFLYADDILLFCKASAKNLKTLKDIFGHYAQVSGQTVNWLKSFVYFGASVSQSRREVITSTMGMQLGSIPFNYLGVPLFRGSPKLMHFRAIVDRIKDRISSWQGRSLSMAGRVCLVNSIITSMFNHYFMIYKWPPAVLKLLGRSIKNFVWTGSMETCKPVTVSWKNCCKPRCSGGLGIKDLALFNDALLAKFLWRFLTVDSDILHFLRSRYMAKLEKGNLFYMRSSIWVHLRKSYANLFPQCRWLIGDGTRVKFWTHNWCGVVLKDLAPPGVDLNTLASSFISNGRWSFPIHWRSICPELAAADDFLSPHISDQLVWEPHPSGVITSKNFYLFSLGISSPPPPWTKFIWKSFIPPSRSILCWRLFLNRLPTDDRFSKIGFSSCSCCSLCYREAEDISHLFLHCPVARSIWGLLENLFRIRINLAGSVLDLFLHCMDVPGSSQIKNLLLVALVSSFSSIWYARNKSKFENIRLPLSTIWAFVISAIRESNFLQHGTMFNSVDDLRILKNLGVALKPSKAPKIIPVVWRAPLPGWIKVNTDGAAMGSPGVAGCGGVFRTSRGFVKGCFWRSVGIVYAFESEIMAVIGAMEYAKQYSWNFIWLESDSSHVVHLLTSRSLQVPWRLLVRWSSCLAYISSIAFKVTHIYREGNMVADALSKLALGAHTDSWSFHLPHVCYAAHVRDMWGDQSFRFT